MDPQSVTVTVGMDVNQGRRPALLAVGRDLGRQSLRACFEKWLKDVGGARRVSFGRVEVLSRIGFTVTLDAFGKRIGEMKQAEICERYARILRRHEEAPTR